MGQCKKDVQMNIIYIYVCVSKDMINQFSNPGLEFHEVACKWLLAYKVHMDQRVASFI